MPAILSARNGNKIRVTALRWRCFGYSALIVSANIPFALFFAIIILVLRDEDANLLSLGAVDFGIIVDSAVIMMENVFRNLQSPPEARQLTLQRLSEGYWGVDPTVATHGHPAAVRWSERLRMIYVSALQVDKAVFFTAAITVTAFVPLFTMQGVEGQIFGPMARTYGYALAGALLATFTVTPVLAALLLPRHVEEVETVIVRALRRVYTPVLAWSQAHVRLAVAAGLAFLMLSLLAASQLGSEFLPALEEGNFWIRASMPPTISLDAGTAATRKMREILLRHPEIITVVSQHGRPDNG
ncbi:MAG: efflux RND transporter permease subunit, partial [Bradyrhizobium sp.]|nr:efflux RND transporter permease subunit [Bradyrhizobium sp.]